MSTFNDLFDEPRVTFRDPAQYEKSGPGLVAREEVKQRTGIRRHSALKGSPMPTANWRIESGHLEVFFKVEC